MSSLKAIRKRISSVRSTQKITRAMKMVAGARLNRAQQRIAALRPYAVQTRDILASVTAQGGAEEAEGSRLQPAAHPLLLARPEKRILYLVLSSDRGQCGSFNTNINKTVERLWRAAEENEKEVSFHVIGRKARDFLRRRQAPVQHVYADAWEGELDLAKARAIASVLLNPFRHHEVDAIYLVYNHFLSAMSQKVVTEPLLPLSVASVSGSNEKRSDDFLEYSFEPSANAVFERLVPMYVEISILRALYESQASELGARMTAMDAATKNAKEMISNLTLQYNRVRQAAITKELMEIIGGAEALKGQ